MGAVIEDVVWPQDHPNNPKGSIEGFSVHAQHSLDNQCGHEIEVYTAWVYLGVEIVWHFEDRITTAYDGLDDFAAYSFRRFSRRLAQLLGTES